MPRYCRLALTSGRPIEKARVIASCAAVANTPTASTSSMPRRSWPPLGPPCSSVSARPASVPAQEK